MLVENVDDDDDNGEMEVDETGRENGIEFLLPDDDEMGDKDVCFCCCCDGEGKLESILLSSKSMKSGSFSFTWQHDPK